MHYLTDILPKPNYEKLKTKKIEKCNFVQTVAVNGAILEEHENSINLSADNSSKLLKLPKISMKLPLIQIDNHI